MTVAEDRQNVDSDFVIDDMWTGLFATRVFASGFGHVGDGRSFAFRVERRWLLVEVYRPWCSEPVPQPEDVIATSRRSLIDIDLTDKRSLTAAVRDSVALAEPVAK